MNWDRTVCGFLLQKSKLRIKTCSTGQVCFHIQGVWSLQRPLWNNIYTQRGNSLAVRRTKTEIKKLNKKRLKGSDAGGCRCIRWRERSLQGVWMRQQGVYTTEGPSVESKISQAALGGVDPHWLGFLDWAEFSKPLKIYKRRQHVWTHTARSSFRGEAWRGIIYHCMLLSQPELPFNRGFFISMETGRWMQRLFGWT